MINLLDTRGYSCPEPVLMAKKALAQGNGETISIITDAGTPKENVTRCAVHMGYSVKASEYEEGFILEISK